MGWHPTTVATSLDVGEALTHGEVGVGATVVRSAEPVAPLEPHFEDPDDHKDPDHEGDGRHSAGTADGVGGGAAQLFGYLGRQRRVRTVEPFLNPEQRQNEVVLEFRPIRFLQDDVQLVPECKLNIFILSCESRALPISIWSQNPCECEELSKLSLSAMIKAYFTINQKSTAQFFVMII